MINQPGFTEAFLPRGRAPLPSERFVFVQAGATLRKIAETRGETFCRGEIALGASESDEGFAYVALVQGGIPSNLKTHVIAQFEFATRTHVF